MRYGTHTKGAFSRSLLSTKIKNIKDSVTDSHNLAPHLPAICRLLNAEAEILGRAQQSKRLVSRTTATPGHSLPPSARFPHSSHCCVASPREDILACGTGTEGFLPAADRSPAPSSSERQLPTQARNALQCQIYRALSPKHLGSLTGAAYRGRIRTVLCNMFHQALETNARQNKHPPTPD